MEKLYFLYSVVSNKTLRQNEAKREVFKRHNKSVLGQLIKTNRGYFIDGHHVDLKSAENWKYLNSNVEAAKAAAKPWKDYLQSLKDKEEE